jgi:hypothetical protein
MFASPLENQFLSRSDKEEDIAAVEGRVADLVTRNLQQQKNREKSGDKIAT